MTQIKELEKATKTLERIKKLDQEIINMDKMAQQLSELGSRAKFHMKVESAEKRLKDVDPDVKCNKGSRGNTIEIGGMTFYLPATPYEITDLSYKKGSIITSHTDPSATYNLNSTVALRILKILLEEKMQKRQRLLHQLQIIFNNQIQEHE